jgi:hypothetical protein
VGPRLLTNLALPRCPQPHARVRHGVLDVRSSIRASGVWLSHPWVDLLGRNAFHTSPLITKSVLAPSDQGLLCWVCVGELNEREY